MKTCINCGYQCEERVPFCNNCGSSFEAMQNNNVQISKTQPTDYTQQPAQSSQPEPQQHQTYPAYQQPYVQQHAHVQHQAHQTYQQQHPYPGGVYGGSTTLYQVSGKPSFVADLILLIINIIIDISFLISGQFIWFVVCLFITVIPATRLINTLRSGVFVDVNGVSGKVKKEQFRYAYHEISSVSVDDQMDNKRLVIVSGYQSHSIRVGNARAVRDAIAYNMAALGVTPSQMMTPLTNAIHTIDYPAVEITDVLRQQIINIYRHEVHGGTEDRLYVFDEVPSEKLENAVKSYAPSIGSDEKVIFLFDNTLIGTGKSGFMLTSKCLYVKNDIEKATKSYIKNICKVFIPNSGKSDKHKATVEMNTGNYITITIAVGIKPEQEAAIARALDETIRLLNNS